MWKRVSWVGWRISWQCGTANPSDHRIRISQGRQARVHHSKSAELGASQIWAFPADWSVAKWDGKKLGKKVEKLEKIALGAAEQSKRNIVPSIQLFEKKADFLAQFDQFDSIVVAYEESAKEGEAAALLQAVTGLEKGAKLLFIFGPEGGLSPVEIESFEAKGAVLAGLGPRILRAETAPLYALSALSVLVELEK